METLKKRQLADNNLFIIKTGFRMHCKGNEIAKVINQENVANKDLIEEGKVFETKDILNLKREIIVDAEKENFKYSEELGCFDIFYLFRETCSENKIAVVYQTSKMRSIWKDYGDLLLMDSTYEVIEKDMELNRKAWAILVINGMNNTEVVCYFIIKNETMACLNPVFNFLSNYNNFAYCKSFLTDKDVKKIDLIISFFPNCEHSYCDLHVKRRLLTVMSKTQRIRLDSIRPLLKIKFLLYCSRKDIRTILLKLLYQKQKEN